MEMTDLQRAQCLIPTLHGLMESHDLIFHMYGETLRLNYRDALFDAMTSLEIRINARVETIHQLGGLLYIGAGL